MIVKLLSMDLGDKPVPSLETFQPSSLRRLKRLQQVKKLDLLTNGAAMSDTLDATQIEACEVIGYEFKDPSILDHALTHASAADEALCSNERMEFLGDAILGSVVCTYLFHHYPEAMEGELTKVKSAAVSRKACAKVSNQMGLSKLIKLGKGMSVHQHAPSSVCAAVLESIVAAIFLDGGYEAAQDFIIRNMSDLIHEAAASSHQDNYKSVLQQYGQRELNHLPAYVLLDEKGPDHCKCFEICVEISGHRYSSAWGQSKKQAEQRAALNALEELGVMPLESEDENHEIPVTLDDESSDR